METKEKKGGKVLILMGLPGSGKTTFAKEYVEEHDHCRLFTLDEKRSPIKLKTPGQEVRFYLKNPMDSYVIDGLLLTEEEVLSILLEIKDLFSEEWVKKEMSLCTNIKPFSECEIHFWEEDREACLYNDKGRRDISSEATIKFAKFEKPDINRLCEKTGISNISLTYHKVKRKPEWKAIADNAGLEVSENRFIRSEEWCLGGTECNYLGDRYYVDPQPPLKTFEELDELILDIRPNLSFLDYRKLWDECVSVKEIKHHDYYGGTVTCAYYEADAEKVFKMLNDSTN